jgi:2'-5' RNA ligase
MPNPEDYSRDDKQKYMEDCMHQVQTVEGVPHDQAVAQCLGMWGNKGKKKKKKKKCASELLRKCADFLLKEFIKIAKTDADYDYSCIKVPLPKDLSEKIITWGKENIADEDLFEEKDAQGREDDIHITLFYGIKSNDPTETKILLKNVDPIEIRLGLINAFKNDDKLDVIKIEVESGALEKLHYEISKSIENDNDYPTYEPHITIAYVKKDSKNDLVGDEEFKGLTFKADKLVFDGSDKSEKELPLGK